MPCGVTAVLGHLFCTSSVILHLCLDDRRAETAAAKKRLSRDQNSPGFGPTLTRQSWVLVTHQEEPWETPQMEICKPAKKTKKEGFNYTCGFDGFAYVHSGTHSTLQKILFTRGSCIAIALCSPTGARSHPSSRRWLAFLICN